MDSKTVVLKATTELFDHRDPVAVDRWISPDYRGHGAFGADGREGLRRLIRALPDTFRYDLARVITDGDFVALHGVYRGLAVTPMVAFDLYRVAHGTIVEHWGTRMPEVQRTASGWSMIDGPDEPSPDTDIQRSRALVTEFAERVLLNAEHTRLPEYVSGVYFQHNPCIEDGAIAFADAIDYYARHGRQLVYRTIHQVVAEGDFVLVRSDGVFGVPVTYWDLFRVVDDWIVEHWDVIARVPESCLLRPA